MNAPLLSDVMARLDDLILEVRKQGRAAVAAQAAAEACLSTIVESLTDGEPEPDGPSSDPLTATAIEIAWLKALIPIADAIDRAVVQATTIAANPSRPRWQRLLFGAQSPAADPKLKMLVEGLMVLKAQLSDALGRVGVSVDRTAGVPIDPDRQRIVEVRAPGPGELSGTVVEVVRPGYSVRATLVREAEVVAARAMEEDR